MDISDQGSGNYVYDANGNLITDKQEKLDIKWNSYGKIAEITPFPNASGKRLKFGYDASGNRVNKMIFTKPYTAGTVTSEYDPLVDATAISNVYYFRDPQGNIMSTEGGWFFRQIVNVV